VGPPGGGVSGGVKWLFLSVNQGSPSGLDVSTGP